MSALGFTKENNEGRYSNGTYLVWDVVPRNVLVDADGDIYNHVVFYLSSVIAQGKTVAYREPLWGCLTIKKVW